MPKITNAQAMAGDVDAIGGSEEHDESRVEQDVHAKDQMNGELLDDVEETGGKAARAEAEEAEESQDESEEGDPEVYEVQSIEGHKFIKSDIFYNIHWKGYDSKKDYTWEPTENLDTAKDVLARYHHRIGGKPEAPQSLKKQKSTQSLKREATEDSPAPKRRKADDAETWRPKREDWEPDVDRIDTIERDEDGQLLVFILFTNGRKLKVSMDQIYRHCPRPMLKFYESHLHFKSVDQTRPEE